MNFVADKYARALTSSNLRVEARQPGDVDALIAAGWEHKNSLASVLYRLRIEWDRIDKRALTLAMVNVGAAQDLPTYYASLEDLTTEGVLARTHVRSLSPAREALRSYVVKLAAVEGFKADHTFLLHIADHVLDLFLEPLCPFCQGRAFKVIPGSTHLSDDACEECEGSGTRSLRYQGEDTVQFIRALRFALDRKMDTFDRRMQHFLSNRAQKQLPQNVRLRLGTDGVVYKETTVDGGLTWCVM